MAYKDRFVRIKDIITHSEGDDQFESSILINPLKISAIRGGQMQPVKNENGTDEFVECTVVYIDGCAFFLKCSEDELFAIIND